MSLLNNFLTAKASAFAAKCRQFSFGDTIKVAQGVYFVSLDTIREVIFISKPITLQGGYGVTDWDNPLPETKFPDTYWIVLVAEVKLAGGE